MTSNAKFVLAALAGGVVGATAATALAASDLLTGTSASSLSILQSTDLAAIKGKQAVLTMVDIPAGFDGGYQFHHGQEIGYVMDGAVDLLVDGKPTQKLKAGDSYQIAAERPFDMVTRGDHAVRLLAVYIVDKDKPLTEAVP